jgi:hypothetical protein
MALDIAGIIESLGRPKTLKELILPEAVRFGSQALGAGVGHLFGGGDRSRAEEDRALDRRLADLYAGREWNAQNYQAGLANQYDTGIGAMKRRLQHAGLENYAKEFGINVDPSLYVPPTFPQTFQTSYQDARGIRPNPLAGTELDTSGRGGGGGWKKWLPAAALASSFLPIPGVGGWLPKLIGLLGGAGAASSATPSYTPPSVTPYATQPWDIDWTR